MKIKPPRRLTNKSLKKWRRRRIKRAKRGIYQTPPTKYIAGF